MAKDHHVNMNGCNRSNKRRAEPQQLSNSSPRTSPMKKPRLSARQSAALGPQKKSIGGVTVYSQEDLSNVGLTAKVAAMAPTTTNEKPFVPIARFQDDDDQDDDEFVADVSVLSQPPEIGVFRAVGLDDPAYEPKIDPEKVKKTFFDKVNKISFSIQRKKKPDLYRAGKQAPVVNGLRKRPPTSSSSLTSDCKARPSGSSHDEVNCGGNAQNSTNRKSSPWLSVVSQFTEIGDDSGRAATSSSSPCWNSNTKPSPDSRLDCENNKGSVYQSPVPQFGGIHRVTTSGLTPCWNLNTRPSPDSHLDYRNANNSVYQPWQSTVPQFNGVAEIGNDAGKVSPCWNNATRPSCTFTPESRKVDFWQTAPSPLAMANQASTWPTRSGVRPIPYDNNVTIAESPKSIFRNNFRSRCRPLPLYDVGQFQTLPEEVTFIDTHCHIDFLFKRCRFQGTYSKFRFVNKEQYPAAYGGCVAIFCDPSTFGKFHTRRFLDEETDVWMAFGCHPHMAHSFDDDAATFLRMALHHKKVVALGEIGLDYSPKNSTPHDVQKRVFRQQLVLALELELPLVIHSRDSTEDTFEILKEMVPRDYKIHRHCFTGDWNEAQQWLDTFPNLYLGLTGLVTYATAVEVHEVAIKMPLDRLLLETDAPYFPPRLAGSSQKYSHPGLASHVAAQIVALRGNATLTELLNIVRKNTRNMYGI